MEEVSAFRWMLGFEENVYSAYAPHLSRLLVPEESSIRLSISWENCRFYSLKIIAADGSRVTSP